MIVGISVKCGTQAHDYPELRERTEQMAVEQFIVLYGFEPTQERVWMFESAHTWTDEETGEVLDVPDIWMLLVEGEKP